MTRHVTDDELRAAFPLVGGVIRHLRARGQLSPFIDRDDVEAVGRAAAWTALQRVDEHRAQGERDWFVRSRVAGAVLDHQRAVTRAEGWTRGHGRVAEVGHLDEPLVDGVPDPVDLHRLVEAREVLAEAQRRASRMRPALRVVAENLLADEPRTLAQVGDELGLTESRVCQMAREARRRMRPPVAA